MSSRDSWVPIAAGLVVGAGLLALLYKAFCGGGPYSNYQHNIGVRNYKCCCKKGEGICHIHPDKLRH
ncbi:unnamed protein product [Colias eurytheme]|nr:unnamed protein product [Colias eurytheme]